ncbi:MAG TPA: hypothetical protein ENJ44_00750, partial [Oceanospirillales bacterium]|nr:hypothetical protein [Oceanospirillales bacterium]
NGGRVLCVCALADDLKTAQQNAYLAVDKIHWNSKYFRTDIGFKALINPAVLCRRVNKSK